MDSKASTGVGTLLRLIALLFTTATVILAVITVIRHAAAGTPTAAVSAQTAYAQPVRVVSIAGSSSSRTLSGLIVTVAGTAHADLASVSFMVQTANTSTHYTLDSSPTVNSATHTGTYSVAYSNTAPAHQAGALLLDEQAEITLLTERPVHEGEALTVRLISSSLASGTYSMYLPEILTEQHVLLYP